MTKAEKIEAIKERARKNFSRGYNCAECVAEAVIHFVETGLPPEVFKMATGFNINYINIYIRQHSTCQSFFMASVDVFTDCTFFRASSRRNLPTPLALYSSLTNRCFISVMYHPRSTREW